MTVALALAGCADDGTATAASATETGTGGSTGTAGSNTTPGTTTTPTTTVEPTSTSTMGTVGETMGTTGGSTSTTTTTSTTGESTGGTTMDVTASGSTSTTGESTGGQTSGTTDGPCAEDQLICDGNVAKVCDGVGGFKSEENCPMECVVPLGCVTCERRPARRSSPAAGSRPTARAW